ncbi:MAG: FAD:protein FMN transferase [Oceanococcaceae bacterium]
MSDRLRALIPASLLILALLAGVWLTRPAEPAQHSLRLYGLGTLIDVQIAGHLNDADYVRIERDLVARLEAFQTRWSVLRDGDLGQLNATLAEARSAPVAAPLVPLLQRAQDICQRSDGRFDPAIGRWIALWGFENDEAMRTTPPRPEEISALRSPSWCAARFASSEAGVNVTLPQAGARLNFGGMAKGEAVEELLEVLHAAGQRNVLVNAGGDLKVLGQSVDRPWRIGIRDPRAEGTPQALAALALRSGEALFSSGDYERYFEHAGVRYHHLLDPATGMPGRRAIAATVLHDDAALADAASTALFIAGPDAAPAVAAALQVDQWMVIDTAGVQHTSPALRARLEDLNEAAPG